MSSIHSPKLDLNINGSFGGAHREDKTVAEAVSVSRDCGTPQLNAVFALIE